MAITSWRSANRPVCTVCLVNERTGELIPLARSKGIQTAAREFAGGLPPRMAVDIAIRSMIRSESECFACRFLFSYTFLFLPLSL